MGGTHRLHARFIFVIVHFFLPGWWYLINKYKIMSISAICTNVVSTDAFTNDDDIK